MRNLLAAGLFRLWRSKSFYATLAVMAAVGAVEPILGYTAMLDLAAGTTVSLQMFGIVSAATLLPGSAGASLMITRLS